MADIVVLNAVVCCYPWMEKMMSAVVSETGTYLALVFPREGWWIKLGARLGALYLSLRDCELRFYVHSVDEIERIAEDADLVARHRDSTAVWQAVVYERVA